MPIQHDYYEGLCALAVSGQIAPGEFTALEEHARACDECRSALAAFRRIAAQALPEYATERFPVKAPAGLTSRFIARARTEGIPLKIQHSRRNWLPSFGLVAQFAGAILLFVLGWNFLATHWRLNRTNRRTESQASHSASPSTANAIGDLTGQLHALQQQLNETEDQLASKQKSLEGQRSELSRLLSRMSSIEQADADLHRELSQRDAEIAELIAHRDQLAADLEKVRATKASQDLVLQTHQSELEDLRAKVVFLNDRIQENQQLSAAAEQAKDLIVARNLHIVDVHDNANGNRPRPFGRIFYTEGKKLIFYAYDLGDSKANAKVTFWVWGEKSGTTEQARHLGILHADDKRDGRWVITFDDSQVLAEINTVFVTAESPKKEPNKPSANRILVAYLGGAPNHP